MFGKRRKVLRNPDLYTSPGWWQRLFQAGRLCLALFGDRRVAWPLKLIPIAAVVYFLSPWDLLPDFVIPGIGQIDDLLILYCACRLFLYLVPEEVKRDYDGRNFRGRGS